MTRAGVRGARPALLVALLALFLVACGGSQAQTVVTYQRAWPDGFHEELTLLDDGRVTMRHGDALERLTIGASDVQRIRDALSAGVPDGESDDGVVRTVVMANGTVHTPVQVVSGTVTELLELLMRTHSLTGSPPPAGTLAPVHSMGAHASP